MKKTIFALATLVSLVACNTTPTTTELAEQAVVESLLDPKSWEGISSEITDSLTVSDLDSIKIIEIQEIISKYHDEARDHLETSQMMVTLTNKKRYLDKAQASLNTSKMLTEEKLRPVAEKYHEIKGTEQDTLVKVVVTVNGYATSRDGEKRIGTFKVEMSPNNEILSTKSVF